MLEYKIFQCHNMVRQCRQFHAHASNILPINPENGFTELFCQTLTWISFVSSLYTSRNFSITKLLFMRNVQICVTRKLAYVHSILNRHYFFHAFNKRAWGRRFWTASYFGKLDVPAHQSPQIKTSILKPLYVPSWNSPAVYNGPISFSTPFLMRQKSFVALHNDNTKTPKWLKGSKIYYTVKSYVFTALNSYFSSLIEFWFLKRIIGK